MIGFSFSKFDTNKGCLIADLSRWGFPHKDWRSYFFIGIVLAFCHPLSHQFGNNVVDVWYFGLVCYSLLGVFWGIKNNRPHYHSPWVLWGIAHAVVIAGALVQARTDDSGRYNQLLSLADIFFVVGYLLIFYSLYLLIYPKDARFPKAGLIDSFILLVGVCSLAWQFHWSTLFEPHIAAIPPSHFRLLYSIMGFVLLGIGWWLKGFFSLKNKAFQLLVATIVFWLAGDFYYYVICFDLPVPNSCNMVLWLISYVCMGTVAMHPSMRELVSQQHVHRQGLSYKQLFLLTSAILCFLTALIIQSLQNTSDNRMVLIVAQVVMLILFAMRLSDLVKQHSEQSQQMTNYAQTDLLTGLFNRIALENQINQRIAMHAPFRLILIDINRFRMINQTFGHTVGDEAIRAFSLNLIASVNHSGFIARIGGDEFAVLLDTQASGLSQSTLAHQDIMSLRDALNFPIKTSTAKISLTLCIGVVEYPAYGDDFSTLMRRANNALTAAKQKQTSVEFFQSEFETEEARKSKILNIFKHALDHDELCLYYQPKYHMGSHRVVGVEALVRWRNMELGEISAHEFIPLLEQTVHIHYFSHYIINQAVRQAAIWYQQGIHIPVSINLSTRNFLDLSLMDEIKQALQKYQLPAHLIDVEITESMAMLDPEHCLVVLNTLKGMGVTLSIDDFGTGYSSLAQLYRLPVSSIKLDKSMIIDLDKNPTNQIIVRSTIHMAKQLGLCVVAEGVESLPVAQLLQTYGCEFAQGFYYSKALPVDRVNHLLSSVSNESSCVFNKMC